MKKIKQRFSSTIVFPALATMILATGCSKDKTPAAPAAPTNDINVATSPTLGRYLTDKNGLTLYMFSNDADGGSSCTGDCEKIWPLFSIDMTKAKLDTSLNVTDFSTITIAGGKTQIAYKGWPLHTFSPSGNDGYGNTANIPEAPGQTRGDGFMGIWFVARPDYTIMLANTQLIGLDGKMYKSDYTVGSGQTTYFTDAKGRTLYTYTSDSFNVNKLTKPDGSNNAIYPVYEQDNAVVPSALTASAFGSITVAGKKQMTYKGWPLYYFGQDEIRGSNKGVSGLTPGVTPVAVKDIPEAVK